MRETTIIVFYNIIYVILNSDKSMGEQKKKNRIELKA